MGHQTPTAGDAVLNSRGQIGIVTDTARKAGPNKGMVPVMWLHSNYGVLERPDTLAVVEIALKH